MAKAKFKTTKNVIDAAVERAGLIDGLEYDDGDVNAYSSISTEYTYVVCRMNSMMRLIGALADDGQDCLMYVE